ncbi:MAG TPA: hypothetical protein VFC77_08150 [Myxococcota bacterium]|nr:hypothetical protein [Myxococcota bacterium]
MQQTVDRREFTVAAVLAALSGVVITISSCGGSDSPTSNPTPNPNPTPTPPPSGDKSGSISGNHGHTAVITAAQLTAGGAISLDIMGTATHTHTVSVSAAEVTQISQGTQVAKTSTSNDGHAHTVTFN